MKILRPSQKSVRNTVEGYACACALSGCPCGSVCICTAWCSNDSFPYYVATNTLNIGGGDHSGTRINDVSENGVYR